MEAKFMMRQSDGLVELTENNAALNINFFGENVDSIQSGVKMFYLCNPEFSALNYELYPQQMGVDGYRVYNPDGTQAFDVLKME